jgi:hypothetical protein
MACASLIGEGSSSTGHRSLSGRSERAVSAELYKGAIGVFKSATLFDRSAVNFTWEVIPFGDVLLLDRVESCPSAPSTLWTST